MVSRGQAYFISEEPLSATMCKEYLFYRFEECKSTLSYYSDINQEL